MAAAVHSEVQPSPLGRVAVLLPVRNVEPALVPLVAQLANAGFGAIILVNDGSAAHDQPTFAKLAANDSVCLLHHAVNLGKGRALKTGINHFLCDHESLLGLVTADADGQHAAADIQKVALALAGNPARAVLGCRGFSGRVPFRSRLGNGLARLAFAWVCGHPVRDTQTGLRAFPTKLLPALLGLQGERYEYEMNVLADLCRRGNIPLEVPIETIYLDGNRSSHFKPLLDSVRIYLVLMRFRTRAFAVYAIEMTLFALAYWRSGNILLSLIAGRISPVGSYLLRQGGLAKDFEENAGRAWRKGLEAIGLTLLCYAWMLAASHFLHWNVIASKLTGDTVVSFIETLLLSRNGQTGSEEK